MAKDRRLQVPFGARSCADNGKEFFTLKALKPIKKGEAVTQNYNPYVIHRPDMALLNYGFVPVRMWGVGLGFPVAALFTSGPPAALAWPAVSCGLLS